MTAGIARRLSRDKPHREMMLRNLVTSLLEHGSVVSTHEKCMEASRLADRVIHWSKSAGHSSKYVSLIQSKLFLSGNNSGLLRKLCGEIAPRYVERPGGYTRVMKLEPRLGDRARQSVLELVDTPVVTAGDVAHPQPSIQRGNMKLWLLARATLTDESLARAHNPQTLLNLKKMLKFRDAGDVARDLLVVRSLLREDMGLEPVNKEQDHAAVTTLIQAAQAATPVSKKKVRNDYKFETARPNGPQQESTMEQPADKPVEMETRNEGAEAVEPAVEAVEAVEVEAAEQKDAEAMNETVDGDTDQGDESRSNAQVIEIEDSDSSPEGDTEMDIDEDQEMKHDDRDETRPTTQSSAKEESRSSSRVVKSEMDESIAQSRREMEELESELGEEARKEKQRVVDELKKQYKLINREYIRRCSRFPISKMRMIAKNDPEYLECTKDALIATAFATELFVQTLTYETLIVNGSVPYGDGNFQQEPKPEPSTPINSDELLLDYKSLSESIALVDHFQFLADIVPRTKNLRELVKENKVRYTATQKN
ncbi:54S ribosomal protein L8, mitochondrial [Nakaseomyces glabratus]|uniref:54S ribosomal protein L8, mitochondrial n=1 Tax=Candida glabrata TaxID=5478 RepID=A0A0W0E7T2_CANGB|nr:54S ribosomal protein L8, mitochondrial [Nakaseomyces glabratus]KTB09189.1 54S ribosomal protein L8, mitochondrial [Nakaseomyces glabratus]KTB11103.1 54S ribosomal protein L8, mitochondrial [Nakaseomyces glabratus]KTB20214.1 54S ribosomal protein L8, mitochondrial [Nakaseomyces glabratus]